MNERIKALMLEAGYAAPELAVRANKLAELIVRECVEICRSDDWEDQQGWGKLYAHKIKKHFGVE